MIVFYLHSKSYVRFSNKTFNLVKSDKILAPDELVSHIQRAKKAKNINEIKQLG